ncbi:CPBP family intramembrane glutamic endopeptidase [Nocardiopsis dassonvillei]|uniref:CPBP family intramembrane glutamic endopeptidase n=1 Tax=Nocardiopsis dassonvillei TaxID=2014 RepID=UPI003F559CE8
MGPSSGQQPSPERQENPRPPQGRASTGRPRSTWTRLAIMFPVLLVVMIVTAPVNAAASGSPVTALPVGVGTAVLALWCYVGLVRRLEHRSVTELAPAGAASGLGRGALLGFGLFTATILLIAALGGYRVTGWGSFEGLLITLGLMTCVAVVEEVLFRGVLFRLLEEKLGTLGSIGCSGLVFGLVHVVNPDFTLWGALAIAVEAGFMLAAAYAATRSLWLPIGLHLAWNVSLAGIYGTGVGGTDVGTGSLIAGDMSGSDLLFGGSSGPEASPLAVLLCSAFTVVLLLLAKRRGRLHRRGEVPTAH